MQTVGSVCEFEIDGAMFFCNATIETNGPFCWYGLTLIPARISNYMPGKVWHDVTYPFKTATVAPLKFEKDKEFHPQFISACNYLNMLGLKLNHIIKSGPGQRRTRHVYRMPPPDWPVSLSIYYIVRTSIRIWPSSIETDTINHTPRYM